MEQVENSSIALLREHLQRLIFSVNSLQLNSTIDQEQRQGIVARQIPDFINTLLAIDAVITAGYPFQAEILLRAAIDRLATSSYLVRGPNSELKKWLDGWKFTERPSLEKRLSSLPKSSELVAKLGLPHEYLEQSRTLFFQLLDSLHGSTHGDYSNNLSQIVKRKDEHDYYWIGPQIESNIHVENLAGVTIWLAIHFTMVLEEAFPNKFVRNAA